MDKIEIRTLRHYWKQNFKASEATRKICDVEGEDVVSTRVAQRWFEKFNSGQNDLQDQPRSGRPLTMDSAMICKSVDSNPSTGTRRLSAELGVAQVSDT